MFEQGTERRYTGTITVVSDDDTYCIVPGDPCCRAAAGAVHHSSIVAADAPGTDGDATSQPPVTVPGRLVRSIDEKQGRPKVHARASEGCDPRF
jgi:hypothetical protein